MHACTDAHERMQARVYMDACSMYVSNEVDLQVFVLFEVRGIAEVEGEQNEGYRLLNPVPQYCDQTRTPTPKASKTLKLFTDIIRFHFSKTKTPKNS